LSSRIKRRSSTKCLNGKNESANNIQAKNKKNEKSNHEKRDDQSKDKFKEKRLLPNGSRRA